MSLVVAFLLIVLASYSLFLVSSRQVTKTQKMAIAPLCKSVRLVKFISIILMIIALYLFKINYGMSISIVALCIFSTPFLFALILYINDLSAKK